MPDQSKAQWRLMYAKEARGELPKGTARRWAHETSGGYKSLPEHKNARRKRRKRQRKSSRSM